MTQKVLPIHINLDVEIEAMMTEITETLDADLGELSPLLKAEVAEVLADFETETPAISQGGDIFQFEAHSLIDRTTINRGEDNFLERLDAALVVATEKLARSIDEQWGAAPHNDFLTKLQADIDAKFAAAMAGKGSAK